jgi:DNA (cytosine-5)-methyltransferase 1
MSVNARQDPIVSDKAQPLDTDGTSQAIMFDPYNNTASEKSPALGTNCGQSTGRSIAFTAAAFKPGQSAQARSIGYEVEKSPSLEAGGGGNNRPAVHYGMAVRRLMPIECERLMGFPDNWTLVPYRGKPAKDGPRYKSIGNSIAVPCLSWIGSRIQSIETGGLV